MFCAKCSVTITNQLKPSTDLRIIAECKALGHINYFMSELMLRWQRIFSIEKERTAWKHCSTGGQGSKENIWTYETKGQVAEENYKTRNFKNYY